MTGNWEPSSDDDLADGEYVRRVGERLRRVRRQNHLSLQAVESASGQEFKASVLGAYERGERAISVPRLQRLATFYNVPVDQLLPRDGVTEDEGVRPPSGGPGPRVALDLPELERSSLPERDAVRRYVRFIQVKRQDFNGQVLTIRTADLDLLAAVLDTSAEQLYARLRNASVIR